MIEETVADGIVYLAKVGVNMAVFTSSYKAKAWVQRRIHRFFAQALEMKESERPPLYSTFPEELKSLVAESRTYEGAVLVYQKFAQHMGVPMEASVCHLVLNCEDE